VSSPRRKFIKRVQFKSKKAPRRGLVKLEIHRIGNCGGGEQKDTWDCKGNKKKQNSTQKYTGQILQREVYLGKTQRLTKERGVGVKGSQAGGAFLHILGATTLRARKGGRVYCLELQGVSSKEYHPRGLLEESDKMRPGKKISAPLWRIGGREKSGIKPMDSVKAKDTKKTIVETNPTDKRRGRK